MGVDGMEMLRLGLTTHFVCEDVADTLGAALQASKSDSDDRKRIQSEPIRRQSIADMLEDLVSTVVQFSIEFQLSIIYSDKWP